MIEISVNKIKKSFGYSNLFENISFDIKSNEKIALIGDNGTGKTTILKMIMGLESIDSGSISIRKGIKIGYLTQIPPKEDNNVTGLDVYLRGIKDLLDLEHEINEFTGTMDSSDKSIKKLDSLTEEFRIKGGYQINEKISRIKKGFTLSDELLQTEYNKLSGGEKTIINLASLILSEPDILLLDEPTNHLDIQMLEWFEEYLKNYKGSVLLVSHDRYFMDRVVNKILEIRNGKLNIYFGNYSYYIEESEKRLLIEFNNYKNQQKEIKSMEEAIKRLKEWGQKSDNPIFFRRAASIEKRLLKMEKIEKPKEKSKLKVNLNSNDRSSNTVLKINNLDLNIDSRCLLQNVNMEIYYQDRVCLMGKNGTGKTTLIKNIINNTHDNIKLGNNIKIGYIPQEVRFYNENTTIYEHMRRIFIGSESELRSKLHQFYFNESDIDKKLKTISGGEKVRIKILELILSNANFLILDEPTNHIDIDTKEIIEEALLEFNGTILFISHDRYFINNIATKIVMLENKKLITYNGNYDYFKSKQVINNEIVEKKDTIKINGSNRLNEFLKDSIISEISNIKDVKIYSIRKKSKYFYLKIANHLSEEAKRLEYLQDKLLITEKVFYEKFNNKSYLLVKALKGSSIKDVNPDYGINIIIDAINNLYNIDYSDCILDATIDLRIKELEDNLSNIKIEQIDRELIDRFITKENIIKYLKGNKPKQIIGFVHGDLTLSNIYSYDDKFSGYLNISKSGIGDIYYDLVSLEVSIEENYGKEYIDIFYDNIGIEKDTIKSEYYKILLSMLKLI